MRVKKLSLLLIALLASLALSYSPAFATNYTTSGWNTGFTATTSVVTQQDGGLVITATWTHSAAELLAVNSQVASNKLVLSGRGPMFCDSALTLTPVSVYQTPAGCLGANIFQDTPAPVDVITTTGAQNTVTTTWTIPANVVGNFDPAYRFFGLRYGWKDSSNNTFTVFSPIVSIGQGMTLAAATVRGGSASSAPVKYSGPEFSGLSLKPVLNGTGTTLEGRKLDQISSITIDGKAAKLSDASDKSLKLELPAGLKPGVYDLVVNTANHGKLTHMNAIRIREELPATSLTIKGTGVLSGEEFKKLTAFSRTQNPDMNTVTCIVNSNSEGKSFMQARALCDRIAANNLNIKTTMFETRSTVEGSAIFARVVFSSEQ
jgi:hypothetical protein